MNVYWKENSNIPLRTRERSFTGLKKKSDTLWFMDGSCSITFSIV